HTPGGLRILEREHTLACFGIPDCCLAWSARGVPIPTSSRDEAVAIGAEGHTQDGVRVFENEGFPPPVRIPDRCPFMLVPGGNASAIRTVGDADHASVGPRRALEEMNFA